MTTITIVDYYDKFFPFQTLQNFLSHSSKITTDFTNREFMLEIPKFGGGTYISRHKSYANAKELKSQAMMLKPTRFDIGGVFSIKPVNPAPSNEVYFPVNRELVFDIDMNDYENFRLCCGKERKICPKCWKFAEVAIKILNQIFTVDFGFKHVLWVFSGGRGIHAWVCDERARKLTDIQRSQFVDYVQVLRNANGWNTITNLHHPLVKRSLGVLKGAFAKIILKEQDLWNKDHKFLLDGMKKVDSRLPELLRSKWESPEGLKKTSLDKWQDLQTTHDELNPSPEAQQKLIDVKKEIIFSCLYPKIDTGVSKARGHTLKSPFCIHPTSQKVCVTFDPLKPFDPFTSPTLENLNGLNKYTALFTQFTNSVIKDENQDLSF